MKMPDLLRFWTNTSMTRGECRIECLKNCSCTAYATLDVFGEKPGCLLWFEDLVDVRILKENGNNTLYLRVTASELHKYLRSYLRIHLIDMANSFAC